MMEEEKTTTNDLVDSARAFNGTFHSLSSPSAMAVFALAFAILEGAKTISKAMIKVKGFDV